MTNKQRKKWDSTRFFSPKNWLLYVSLALSVLMIVGCAVKPVQNTTGQTQTPGQNQQGQNQEPKPVPIPEPGPVSQEESQVIAVQFLRNSPTFRFDGMESTLKLVESGTGTKPGAWVFHYTFQSRQAGYGDRTGMVGAQVITAHKAQIVVEQGAIVSAVLDDRWDELKGKRIE